jgi:Plasma-membrane choline transporter
VPVYVGLYGYGFITAGKKVMTLFVERGWTAIINDNLVVRVLDLVSLVIGALTGCVGLLLASVRPGWIEEFGSSSTLVAFSIPALIGTAMAYILMSVVASAVDTVVVAFAEAPMEFERNHPGLSSQLVAAWREVYPEEFGR